ncbi:MAG: phosphoribosylanthranilate isomerase [Syntrophobacteraceae bacterium]|nr:phosphoribosylanthranilate isomerase [Syntrophobacteraceae bacterium]
MEREMMFDSPGAPQVKVCGLTVVEEAVACAQLGADAIGLVFYPPSPRFVTVAVAKEIGENLPKGVFKVGLFVDEPFLEIVKIAELCRLDFVQLHGCEPPAMVEAIESTGIPVIKALFAKRKPFLADADDYRGCALLVEGGGGGQPGGVGLSWEWSAARDLAGRRHCILAGGLNPENVGEAICQVGPDAVDVSSGVESAPGRKDKNKVRAFIEAVRNAKPRSAPGRIFK